MRARVLVKPKAGILDPQGQAVERALPALGFHGVRNVSVGRMIDTRGNFRSRKSRRLGLGAVAVLAGGAVHLVARRSARAKGPLDGSVEQAWGFLVVMRTLAPHGSARAD